MSDDYVYVIPEEPGLVPEDGRQQSAADYFRSIAPKAGKITVSVWDHLKFIDCGGNFGEIYCPSCRALVDQSTWGDWMEQDFQGKEKGFVLSKRALPCCGAQASLHDLSYEWPQGFARFNVCAENAGIGKLSEEQRCEFEHSLGCSVRIIYEHI